MSLPPPSLPAVTSRPIRRALLSVTDKRGLLEFARGLVSRGVELISTGGTAKALREQGVQVTAIEDVTGFPEMMHGRLKTLHPKVHGGLLGLRDSPEHARAMAEHGIEAIDLLCVNLYAFTQTAARLGCTREEAVENIDIGGPSMIRSAAKNHLYVTVVTDPADYSAVLAEMDNHDGAVSTHLRQRLAAEAFAVTAAYDAAIASYLLKSVAGQAVDGGEASPFPEVLCLAARKVNDLRYGENPHQRGALYAAAGAGALSIAHATQHHGKELSYNNINDGAAALELVAALKLQYPSYVGACCVKHTNPCGAAIVLRWGAAESAAAIAIDEAIAGDPLAAFGGIIACNAPVDVAAAERLCAKDVFFEVVIAPSFSEQALAMLMSRWANLRIVSVPGLESPTAVASDALEIRSIRGGYLMQATDSRFSSEAERVHAAGPAPSPSLRQSAGFLEVIGKFLFSNAVVIGGPSPTRRSDQTSVIRMFGAGAGQMDRVASCRLAVAKAGDLSINAAAYSDAFFPFADGPQVLLDAGVRLLMHPGGSKRDQDTFNLCNQLDATCLVSAIRHFRH